MNDAAALAAGTLVSEDLTLITAGLLIRAGSLDLLPTLLACFVGIYVGDLGLWLAGRLAGRRLLKGGVRPAWLGRRLTPERLRASGAWLDRNAPAAILASRFLPGARLPLYVAAGALGRSTGRFLLWSFVAALAWTPLFVLLVAWTGEAFAAPPQGLSVSGGLRMVPMIGLMLGLATSARLLLTRAGRGRLAAWLERIRRWEFWPVPLFYAPVVPWIAWLSIRHRGFGTITAANPGIPDGGFVGESKYAILRRLPRRAVVPGARIDPGPPAERVETLRRLMRARGWDFPLVLKPDVGERGAGVRMIGDLAAAADYLARHAPAVLAQTWHPGPREAGIFYYRLPGAPSGHIFSVTDKRFPEVVGDGEASLEELIRRHPRHRMQARVFLARHRLRLGRVLAAGESLRLAHAGNHVQGTMFLDGARLITPALERSIDDIARRFDGFYFGRFDVRYADEEALRAGRDFAIVELNGVTSESTNIYDPAGTLLQAYRTLYRQWRLLFRIGALNRRRAVRATPALRLLRATIGHFRQGSAFPIAD